MQYGTEVLMRGSRYFDYKRVDELGQPTMSRLIWSFTCLGTYAPEDEGANEAGYVQTEPGYIRSIIVSANTEGGAVELLRDKLNPDGIWYDRTHWNLELIGLDLRQESADPIITVRDAYL